MKKLYVSLLILIFASTVLFYFGTRGPSPKKSAPSVFPTPTIFQSNYTFPTLAPRPTIISYSANQLGTITFNDPQSSFPATAPTYRLSDIQVPDESVTKLVSALGFTGNGSTIPDANNTTTLMWSTSEKTLHINQRYGLISYSSTRKNSGSPISSEEQIVSAATSFLRENGIPLNDASPVVSYYKATQYELGQVATFTEADTYIVSFPFTLNSTPVYSQGGGVTGTFVTVTKSGAIQKVVIQHPFPADSRTYPLASLSEIRNRIENGQGVVVLFQGESSGIPPSIKLTRTTITDIHLGYLVDPASYYIYPITLAQAEGTDGISFYPMTVYVLPSK